MNKIKVNATTRTRIEIDELEKIACKGKAIKITDFFTLHAISCATVIDDAWDKEKTQSVVRAVQWLNDIMGEIINEHTIISAKEGVTIQ